LGSLDITGAPSIPNEGWFGVGEGKAAPWITWGAPTSRACPAQNIIVSFKERKQRVIKTTQLFQVV